MKEKSESQCKVKDHRHRQPEQKNQPPQDPGSQTEPGAPSVSRYFPETCRSDILTATQMSTNSQTANPGHPAGTFSAVWCLFD